MSRIRQDTVPASRGAIVRPNPRLITGVALLVSAVVSPSVAATPYPAQVVVPIPSVQVVSNECSVWRINKTYTATKVPGSVLSTLDLAGAFSINSHFHTNNYPGGGKWETDSELIGTAEEKLAQINKAVFRESEPAVGQIATYTNSHLGTCAADEGLRECVGIFVSPRKGEFTSTAPLTFPFGACSGIPPASVSCHFASASGTVGLGAGGRGTRVGTTTVSVGCTRPVAYRVSELPGTVDPDSLQIVTLKVQGVPLPYVSPGTQATENLTIEVEAKVSSEGFLSTHRVLRIDIH